MHHIHEALTRIERNSEEQLRYTILNVRDVFSVEDAALYSGKSERTVRDWCNNGLLTHSKPTGKEITIAKQDLIDFLLSNKFLSKDAISELAEKHIKKAA